MPVGDSQQRFLSDLRKLTQAVHASVFVGGRVIDQRGPMLVHDGDGEPLPELSNAEVALRTTAGHISDEDSVIQVIASESGAGHLLRIAVGVPAEDSDLSQLSPEGERRKRDQTSLPPEDTDSVWLGLQFENNTPPFDLDSGAGGDTAEDFAVQVATDGAGGWVAVWQTRDPESGGLDFDIPAAPAPVDDRGAWRQ